MWSELAETVWGFRAFIGTVLAAAPLVGAASLCFCRKLTWAGRRMKYYGVFSGLTAAGTAKLAFLAARLLFILSSALFCVRMDGAHLLLLALLWAGCGLILPEPAALAGDFVNTAAVGGALAVENLLASYLREVHFEWGILVVTGLLALFIIQYALYFFLRGVGRLSAQQLRMGRRDANGTVDQ